MQDLFKPNSRPGHWPWSLRCSPPSSPVAAHLRKRWTPPRLRCSTPLGPKNAPLTPIARRKRCSTEAKADSEAGRYDEAKRKAEAAQKLAEKAKEDSTPQRRGV